MKKIILSIFVFTAFFMVSNLALTFSSSPPPIANTNAPGESNCTGCHSGTLQTSGSLFNAISLTSSVALSAFQPNTTYPITVTFTNSASVKYGFQFIALPSGATAGSASVGTLATTDPGVAISIPGGTPVRIWAAHNPAGTAASGGSRSWTFNWTTPAAFNGGVVFYVIVNSSNNNSNNTGDVIIARQFSATVLPVEWLNIIAKRNENNVFVKWVTASEQNNDRFEIERSTNNTDWEFAGVIKGKGNSAIATHYSFTDDNNEATYYRIKQIDFDGTFDYSPIVSLEKAVYPLNLKYDIAQEKVIIEHANLQEGFVIYSLQGLPVLKGELSSSIDVSSLTKGVYLFQTSTNQTSKLLIN